MGPVVVGLAGSGLLEFRMGSGGSGRVCLFFFQDFYLFSLKKI